MLQPTPDPSKGRSSTLTAFYASTGAAAAELSTPGTWVSTLLGSEGEVALASVSAEVLVLCVCFGEDDRRRWLEGTMAASNLLKSLYASKEPAMAAICWTCSL